MNIGICIASTGGTKLARTLRSLRRAEPEPTFHVMIDGSSKNWQRDKNNPPLSHFQEMPNVVTSVVENTGYVNGTLNKAMKWMKDFGYTHVCLLQDDLVFSSLPENLHHISEWFEKLREDPALQAASGITFSCMEALVPSTIEGHWQRPPNEWDARDLESPEFWQILCPGGKPVGYFGEGAEPIGETHFPNDPSWFVHYYGTNKIGRFSRLGPSGQIIPVANWEAVGGFDEEYGIFYDIEFPIQCAQRKIGNILIVPNVPYLHLHNQSTAYGDPAVGRWGDTLASFRRKYGVDVGVLGKDVDAY